MEPDVNSDCHPGFQIQSVGINSDRRAEMISRTIKKLISVSLNIVNIVGCSREQAEAAADTYTLTFEQVT